MHGCTRVSICLIPLQLSWRDCLHSMPSLCHLTCAYTACNQDAVVNASEHGAATASARESFDAGFRLQASHICILGRGSTAYADCMKEISAIAYSEYECPLIRTPPSSPRNRFCRRLLCIVGWTTSKGWRSEGVCRKEEFKAPNGACVV